MALSHMALRYGQRGITRRLVRSIPWLGAVLAVAYVGTAIRRKGVVGGTMDSALNAIPFVGGMKLAAEMVRWRDFIRDRDQALPRR